MKQIDYKLLRSYLNLPKYDPGMTPISSGYLGGDYTRSTLSIIKSSTPFESNNTQALSAVAENFTPMLELGKSLGKTWSAVNAAKDASSALNTAQSIQGVASKMQGWTGVSTIENSPGYISNLKNNAAAASSSAKGAMLASRGVAALAALYGGYKSIADADKYGRSPITSGELLDSAGQFVNESGAHLYGGIADTSKYLRDYNNAGMTSSVTSGMTFGAGAGTLLGSLAGPAGSVVGGLIGTGIGALGGAITGWINRGKAKRKLHEAQENLKYAIAGYNRQSDAEARDQIIKNEYALSHFSADEGLDLFSGEPNAAIGGGETVVKTKKVNGKTRVTDAKTMPITPEHPWRLDNYPVKLDKGSGVAGNKYDPFTGVPYSLEAVFAAEKFNSNDPYAKAEGELELLDIFDRQSKTPNNNPNPYEKMRKYNCGKSLRKMDYGGRDALKASHYLNIIPAALGMVEGYKELRDAEKMPTTALNSYVEAPSLMQAINSMPTVANINPLLREITDQDRYNDYVINQTGGLTKGQKMLMRSQAQANRLKAYADAYAKKWDLEQQLGATKANAWLNVSNNMATRAQQALREQIDNLMKAQGAKYNAKAMARKNMFTPLYAMAENWNNNNWQLAMMNLYEQKLSQEQKDSLRGR